MVIEIEVTEDMIKAAREAEAQWYGAKDSFTSHNLRIKAMLTAALAEIENLKINGDKKWTNSLS